MRYVIAKILCSLCLCGFIIISQAHAQTLPPWPFQHGIAMQGQPALPSVYKHFAYTNPNAPKGGTLKLAGLGSFDSFNPFLLFGKAPDLLGVPPTYVYETLMARNWDEPFTLYGLIAQQVAVAPDRSGIIFKLNPAAKFADGKNITVDDVLFSWDILRQHGRPNMRRVYSLVDKTVRYNDHTIGFFFKKGYDRETVMILAMMPVLPKHAWPKADNSRDFSKTTLQKPLASGPYEVSKFEVGQYITYQRRADYWGTHVPSVKGHYNFDTIRIDYYKDDSVARQALFAGAYDMRREANANIWQRDYPTQKIVQDKKLKLLEAKHQRPEPAKFLVFNQRVAPFDNLLVRQALRLAFDANWFNKQVLGGAFEQVDSIFPNSPLANPKRVPLVKNTARQNLQQATKLLAQAGWVVDNNVLVNVKTKQPMQFEILLNDAADEKIALHWQRGLKRLGVQTTIRTVDTAEYTRRLSNFDFTVAAAQWRNSLSPGSEQKLYWGCQAAASQGSFNYAGVCLPVAERAMHALTAATTRGALVQAAQSLDAAVMASVIGVPLFYQAADHVAYKPFLQQPVGKTPLYGPVLETWWVQ